jgi:hypothetical protein
MGVFLLVFALMFTACDKNEELEVSNDAELEVSNDAEISVLKYGMGYVINDADLLLLATNIHDFYQNHGNLYENENDTTEAVFEITTMSLNCPKPQHTFTDVTVSGVRTVSCTGAALDCYFGEFDYGGHHYDHAIMQCK